MGRHGLHDDCDDDLAFGRYRAQVKSTIRGKNGQAFLRELVGSLEAMPDKRLIAGDLKRPNGEVCAIGSVGVKRGIALETLDVEDPNQIAEAFGVTHQLVREIEWVNDDDDGPPVTPEQRWTRVHEWAKSKLKQS